MDQLVRTKKFLLRIFVQAFSCALVSLATAVAHASLCFRDANTSLDHSSRHILLHLGYRMENCARNSYDLALGVQKITYEVHPAPYASKRRRRAEIRLTRDPHSPGARSRSLPTAPTPCRRSASADRRPGAAGSPRVEHVDRRHLPWPAATRDH